MADNVILNPGAGGATAASDDIGGIQYQRVKLTLGADGVNDGDASETNPIPTSIKKFCILNESSSIAPLAGTATWTSTVFSTVSCGTGILVMFYADQDGTVYLDEQITGGAFRVTAYSPYTAGQVFAEMHVSHADNWRVRFVNGAVPQGTFEAKVSQIPWGIPWVTKIDPQMNGVTQFGGTAWLQRGQYSEDTSPPSAATAVWTIPAIATANSPSQSEGNLVSLSTNLEGKIRTVNDTDGAPAITRVSQNAASVMLVAANGTRGYTVIHNESDSNLKIKYGTTASATSYTYKIRPDETWEMPSDYHYEGQIDGIWDAAGGGAAQVTDMTHA
jgi:hypothetical protein